MARGDHIYVYRYFPGFQYTHHGIDCGDGTVIHYSEEIIERIAIQEFSQGKNIHKWLYEYSTNTIFTLNPIFNKKNIIFLSPDLDGILWAYEYGFNAILCNQNCFIDYNKFFYSNKEITYSMVMNCRPELWKQPYLAENVIDLAYIKGATYGEKKYDYSK